VKDVLATAVDNFSWPSLGTLAVQVIPTLFTSSLVVAGARTKV
jgi:hypothetical protein